MLTWDEPGEWIVDPVKRLRHCAVRLGVDERGAATMMLIVKYDPGSQVEPHYHHSDYASIVVEGSIEMPCPASSSTAPTRPCHIRMVRVKRGRLAVTVRA
jgi:hypothetical protein